GSPVFGDLFTPALVDLLGPRRGSDEPVGQSHRDIARSAQAVYEEAFFNLIEGARADTGLTDLALAGGCANNSVANGKVRRQTTFKRLYAHAAPGDAGGAIGAAFAVWHEQGGARIFVMDHAYWGPEFANADHDALIKERRQDIDRAGCTIEVVAEEGALCDRVA